MFQYIYRGVICYNFQSHLYLSESRFILANSVDPDAMLHIAVFHISFQCLPKYSFRSD